MIIIPAIDIRGGRVVRLLQGDFDKETVYSGDPVNMAVRWQREGAKMLHIVDLDGAFFGKSVNLPIIKSITSKIKIPIELGGGLRTEAQIVKALSAGVKRVILGTKACKDQVFLKNMVKKYREAVVASIDTAKNAVASEGWKTKTAVTVDDIVKKISGAGVETIVYTDILKDGTMKGPNIKGVKHLLKNSELNIIASGGVSCLDDIAALKSIKNKKLVGVIAGKALYEGAFSIGEANKILE